GRAQLVLPPGAFLQATMAGGAHFARLGGADRGGAPAEGCPLLRGGPLALRRGAPRPPPPARPPPGGAAGLLAARRRGRGGERGLTARRGGCAGAQAARGAAA